MRILLTQAVSTHDGGELVFPLGLARLAAAVGRCHDIKGLDLNLDPFPWPGLVRTLEEFRPHLVAVSLRNLDPLAGNLLSFVPHLKTLAAIVADCAPESQVLLGGSGFTLFPQRLMAEVPQVDIGFAGEADGAFSLLVENLAAPWNVPGALWRRDDGSIAASRAAPCGRALDALPFPDWRVFDPRRYRESNDYVAFMGVETKRGCPNRCRYCLYPALQGRGLRLRPPEQVVDELQALHDAHQIKLVHFTDPVVNQPAEHLRAVCRAILARRLEIGWTGFFREDTLTAADMELYRRSGLATWYFSADGASEHALQLLSKDLTRDHIVHAARLAAESGVLTVCHFLVNLPGESRGSVDESRRLLDTLFEIHAPKGNLGAVVVNNLRLYPGAPLTEQILKERLADPRQDLLYPTYFNPPPWDHLRHELTADCMRQGVAGYLAGPRSPHRGAEPDAHRPA
jgi:putative variant cofactor biosynthesis B12-binding/radical SAM domain protein 1